MSVQSVVVSCRFELQDAGALLAIGDRGRLDRPESGLKHRGGPVFIHDVENAFFEAVTVQSMQLLEKYNSGELEIDELHQVMAHLGLELSKGEFDHYAAALMEDYDTDNSGSLDFWEFEKFYEQCLASDDLRAAYANELDAAVKGVVSGALSNILEQHEMENAALKIQAVHRGKQARKELQEQKEMDEVHAKMGTIVVAIAALQVVDGLIGCL